jgi:PAS domain S-box-containing protein
MNWLAELLTGNQFLPHRFCIANSPELLTVSVFSNLLIFFSYFTIPITLVYFTHQRKDLNLRLTVWLFACFILACGSTHLLHVVTYWRPWYRLQALFDVATALISLYTAIHLWKLLPHWLNLPNHAQLLELNRQLQYEISENKRINQALRHSEQRFKTVFETAPLGIAIINSITGDIDEVNLRYAEIVGLSIAEMKTVNWMEFTHPDDIQDDLDNMALLNTHKIAGFKMEKRYIRPDKSIVWVIISVVPFEVINKIHPYHLCMVEDISERKQAEQTLYEKSQALQRSNTDLEQFAYSVSHDMRQPLRSVTCHLQLIERALQGKLDEDSQTNLNFALEGAKRMDAMIVSLLEYSRVGRKTESKTYLETRAVLDEALDFLAVAIEEARANITISGQWPTLFASRDELSRLFLNLIGNAIKYHEPLVEPKIEIVAQLTASQMWQVTVRDQGIGVNPEQIPRLFQFFSRLQSRTRFEGTGMGLALCRRIVDHHGGNIWVESAGENQGCCFMVTLPVHAPVDVEHPL